MVTLRLDGSWQRFGRVVLAGSPLRLFRTTVAGAEVLDRLEAGEEVAASSLIDRLLDGGGVHPVIDLLAPPQHSAADVTVVTPQLRTDASSRCATDGRLTVDDGSTPPLPGAALRLATTQGPGAARNAGRSLVDTDFIAFVDADVTIEAGWLDTLLRHFDDPQVGLVAPRVSGEVGSPLDLGAEPARIRAGTRVSYVPGAALVVRVAAFDAIGGFDPTLRFGEDVDFVWRLDEAGWRCRYEPAVTVWHEPRRSISARLRQHASYGTSAAPLALRHPHALAPWRANGWTALVWAAGLTGRVGAAGTTAVGSALALQRKLPDVPRDASFRLAMRGHLLAGAQVATAVRRAWWPIVAVGALVSRRLRWIAAASLLLDVRAAPTDLAYGWGVWTGMWRHRTWAPIVPQLSAWPGRSPRPGPSTGPATGPATGPPAPAPPRGPGEGDR
jgi:mycofactocin glycosyltransferase